MASLLSGGRGHGHRSQTHRPPQLVATAREYAAGVRTPAEPRNAATVALTRRGGRGPEVYLLRRHAQMAFAAGMYVFPGGVVDERDDDAALAWAGPGASAWAAQLGVAEPLARALVAAAVRETFEESGVLLAGPDPTSVVPDTTGTGWEADRQALESRDLSLTELLARRGLVLRADLLGAWSGWLTPDFEPRRYRTWFFVAELPQGQVTRDVSGESDSVTWLPAAEAVRAADAGELLMLPPTYLTCLELAGFADPEAALAAAASRRVEMFMPELVDGAEPTLSHPPWLEGLIAGHREAP
ncbi:MAG: NUDIX domain-containing protein [Nocardioides sp.]